MKFRKEVMPDGNLLITADNETRTWLKEHLQETSVVEFWPIFVLKRLRYWHPWLRYANGQDLTEMGALTSSPVLIETMPGWGKLVSARVWWFPQYETKNEFNILKQTGRLVMTLAKEY